ncbi:MAG TPA: hypothetical protein P5080_03925 [Candidatus Paceibacterota bacterium]|nr:hypothetical protein [Candidatus Pacearchaeota archaeon]HRZ51169.1 hypothetical protein [Candidatus Paceibacterota bacterium]HSA36824.1 hypothetical protein [Candidatus Paceibacterota bacterium]
MKAVIQGYGPKGLVEELRKAEWSPCAPDGENFTAIDLFECCLTRPADRMVVPLAVLVKEGEEAIFKVTGYGFPNIFKFVALWLKVREIDEQADNPIMLSGFRLANQPMEDFVQYDILILDQAGLEEYEARDIDDEPREQE